MANAERPTMEIRGGAELAAKVTRLNASTVKRALDLIADRNLDLHAIMQHLIALLDLNLDVQAGVQQLIALIDRWIAHGLGRREWRLRAPDRRADPTACHRGPAPPAASRPHVLIVGG